ncbi:MAG: methylated-DNA--[protein]-cysteine S-methyltransferase [Gammaproteobacteria bacterium]|nr:methylated-DNA--[protein]-cysteine S-methyltransferase [Gammaproteobacteria bacterium]MCP5423563.1 methylated-DNA--[protein]-cysteine S-methyltransferase [Gammaproteobacteria bacterium]
MKYFTFTDSPLGPMLLTSNGAALTGAYFVGQRHYPPVADDWRQAPEAAPFAAAREALRAYFTEGRAAMAVPLKPEGTDYQRRIWRAIATAPFATTISYGELSARLGNPQGARAAGAATGRNPLSLFIPCHRIVGGDGALTGYAGGLERKRALLAFEARVAAGLDPAFPALQVRAEPETV